MNTSEMYCEQTRAKLSEYLDGALTARDTLAVEAHLAVCRPCLMESRDLSSTVAALRGLGRRDTSDGFMAALHQRLDTLSSAEARPGGLAHSAREMLASLRSLPRGAVRSAGFAVAACALGGILYMRTSVPAPIRRIETPVAVEPLAQHVALMANNPLDDPVAARLEADRAERADSL